MGNYLTYSGFGFFTLILYYLFNLVMLLFTNLFYVARYDEIYGTFEVERDPNILIEFFIILLVAYIFILLGFFLFGKVFRFGNEKMPLAFILFIFPNIAIQILVYLCYSVEMMSLLNWFMKPFGDVFFFESPKAHDLAFSYCANSLFTYIPFIFTFLGGLVKKRQRENKKTGDD